MQQFVEAKRHQPSVIYIPSLTSWCAAVSETARTTVRSMLDSLAPTDPILLLAVVDGTFASLPRDVKAWFGPTRENRVALELPSADQRLKFFQSLLNVQQLSPARVGRCPQEQLQYSDSDLCKFSQDAYSTRCVVTGHPIMRRDS